MQQNPYESQSYVADYLLMHYGNPSDLCPFDVVSPKALQFHRRLFEDCVRPLPFTTPTRGLDLGCGVGRFTLELSRIADHVLGLDSSMSFIEAAHRMVHERGQIIFIKESGSDFSSVNVKIPEDLPQGKVEFQVGDAMDLTAFLDQTFHIVAAVNLICRLPHPRQCLSQLERIIVPEGQLIIASPFSWMEDFTTPAEWMTSQEMEEVLEPHFQRVSRQDLPFVIRDHRRKYQLVVSEVSIFKRRG